jgi:hypothetical protein
MSGSIDDTTPSTTKIYSSAKIETLVSAPSLHAHLQINDSTPSTTTAYSGDKIKTLVDAVNAAHIQIDDITPSPGKVYSCAQTDLFVEEKLEESVGKYQSYSVRIPARDYSHPDHATGGKVVFDDKRIVIKWYAHSVDAPTGQIKISAPYGNDSEYVARILFHLHPQTSMSSHQVVRNDFDVFYAPAGNRPGTYFYQCSIDPKKENPGYYYDNLYMLTYSGSELVSTFCIQKYPALFTGSSATLSTQPPAKRVKLEPVTT